MLLPETCGPPKALPSLFGAGIAFATAWCPRQLSEPYGAVPVAPIRHVPYWRPGPATRWSSARMSAGVAGIEEARERLDRDVRTLIGQQFAGIANDELRDDGDLPFWDRQPDFDSLDYGLELRFKSGDTCWISCGNEFCTYSLKLGPLKQREKHQPAGASPPFADLGVAREAHPEDIERMLSSLTARGTLSPTTVWAAYAVLRIALGTGMRQGERLALRWTDVNLDAGTVTIRHTLERGTNRLAQPKTDRSRRTLHVPLPVMAILVRHQHDRAIDRVEAKAWGARGFVFANAANGGPLDGLNVTGDTPTRALRTPVQRPPPCTMCWAVGRANRVQLCP